MSETPEHNAPEPTLADVLAVMQAGFAQLTTEIAGVKADIADVKNEVQKTEASLTERVADVQRVVRTLKSDLAGHVGDPNAHPHRHAA